jgi:YaaC-like Protein
MPAPELLIGNRAAYLRKAICTPDFTSERVLARDAFQFAELWLKRECPRALPFWDQARSYYAASGNLPVKSSPLTSYFCFLNAAKALLTVKGIYFSDYHGVSGKFDPVSKRALSNEKIAFRGGGILPELSRFLQEEEANDEHTLKDVLSNLQTCKEINQAARSSSSREVIAAGQSAPNRPHGGPCVRADRFGRSGPLGAPPPFHITR